MTQPHFTTEMFEFLTDLKANNKREWFQANKKRYEQHVKEPLLRFITDFGPLLREISPHFVADPRPVGGSMFRIYRDVRFAKNKSPYKTHAAAQFRHTAGKDVHAPGFYLHLDTELIHAGTGLWHPDSTALAAIRNTIVDDPEGWKNAVSQSKFTKRHRLAGESLKRPPRGFDSDHPLVEDLKRKDFVSMVDLPPEAALKPGFVDEFAGLCAEATDFMRYLTKAVGLEF
ncbi:MAG: DUF2461 domain-containing protein [bacterium]|nr:DUF2461 domain-containing protein [bacterium]